MFLQKRNKLKKLEKKLVYYWHLDPDPDPLVRGMDPRIRIRTKMSWIRIRNTDSPKFKIHQSFQPCDAGCRAHRHSHPQGGIRGPDDGGQH